MREPILVTAAIIKKGNKYLITQRPASKSNGLRWEFPGGRVEFAEGPDECIRREMKEELGIDITIGDIFGFSSHVYSEDMHVILLALSCKIIAGEIQRKEIKDYAWVLPGEMGKYDITEADLPFVRKLQD